jgi:hypothetical protein
MGSVRYLASDRRARASLHLEAARLAQAKIESARQRDEADLAANLVIPCLQDQDPGAARTYAAAAELKVDAQLNMKLRHHARASATEAERLLKGSEELPAAIAKRLQLTVRELSGAPEVALREFAAREIKLRSQPGAALKLERLRCFQHMLTCTKRCDPQSDTRFFFDVARTKGLSLAEELEETHRHEVACFRHVLGYAEMRFLGNGGDADRACTQLGLSLANRRDTDRDRATRGMGEGERLLAEGSREDGIELLNATVVQFHPILPRHYDSGHQMLVDRGLLAA